MDSQNGQDTLYRRLGGYDAIAGIVADLFQRMKEDERFRRFGQGRGLDSKARAQQLTVDLICNQAGGPCFYLGRDTAREALHEAPPCGMSAVSTAAGRSGLGGKRCGS